MRHAARWVFGFSVPLYVVVAATTCGTDAVGTDACSKIEQARCEVAPQCDPEVDTDRCNEFYRDQCLHGIQNMDHTPSDSEAEACVAAVKATATCQASGKKTMAECPDVAVSAEGMAVAPCDVLLKVPEKLAACAWVAAPDAGVVAPPVPDADGATDAPDAPDDAPEGGPAQ